MDPFSITIGAIGLAGAANKATGSIIKRLKALRDAPEELQELLAELSQFEEILQAIQNAADPSETTHSPLETLVETAKDKILELHRLIEYRLTKAGTSSEVDRSQWAGSQKDVDRLRKQLTNIRANLHVSLSISTNITVGNTRGLLRQVNSDNHAMGQIAAALLRQILQEVQSTGSAVAGILDNFPHLTLESSHSNLQSGSDTAHGSFLAQTGIQAAYGRSSLQVQPRKTHEGPHCRSSCLCECHRTYYSSSPWLLARFFGRAWIEKKDSAGVGASHHLKSCKASDVSQIQVIYFVPTWFAMKAYVIRYTSSPLHGPEWLIKTPRLVNRSENRGLLAIENGDLPMFRSSIANGECTPYDIYEDGHSMLMRVVSLLRIDFMTHLVGMGVDLCQPVGIDTSLLKILWLSLSGWSPTRSTPQDFQPLRKLIPSFPFDDYSESAGFTLLHEIVCHLNDRDLDSALQTDSADVNELNKGGESPLELAVKFNNIAAVQTLLKRGADPNINDGTPMYLALDNRNLATVDLLLRSGATVHGDQAAGMWINTKSFLGEDHTEELNIDRLLIEYGVDVNHQVLGRSKVMALCRERYDYNDRIDQLIGRGADLELRDHEGYTALHWAVCANNPKIIETLIRSGARINVKTNEGNTIAHLAVICGRGIWFANMMHEMDLGTLDLNLKNEDGHTVYDLLRKRNGLQWETYYTERRERNFNRPNYYWWSVPYPYESRAWWDEDEYELILALEALLHHIQDLQGIPKDQQFPPLGKYLSDDKDEDPVPGAWPV